MAVTRSVRMAWNRSFACVSSPAQWSYRPILGRQITLFAIITIMMMIMMMVVMMMMMMMMMMMIIPPHQRHVHGPDAEVVRRLVERRVGRHRQDHLRRRDARAHLPRVIPAERTGNTKRLAHECNSSGMEQSQGRNEREGGKRAREGTRAQEKDKGGGGD
jgi:uncharacterized membrane protein